MALDAFVYCDCFETNNLRCNPPAGVKVRITPNGDLACDTPTDAEWSAFIDWKQNRACLHYGMILLRHRLQEKCPDLQIVPTGRGRFALQTDAAIEMIER